MMHAAVCILSAAYTVIPNAFIVLRERERDVIHLLALDRRCSFSRNPEECGRGGTEKIKKYT